MSDTLDTTTDTMTDESFAAAMTAKYSAEDAAHVDASDDMDEGDEPEGGSTATSRTDDAGDAGHTATGTSDDPDGDRAEPGEDPEVDDDLEHPDGDPDKGKPTDSADVDKPAEGGEAEAKKEEEEDPEAAVAEDTKALLAAKGADLKLEDVPDQYRPIVENKLRSIDRAFSRQSQENTAWRAERAQINAERQFQKDHPELVIAELLRQHPELEAKALEASPDMDDAASVSAFDKKVADARDAAKQAAEVYEQRYAAALVRADETVETATRLAKEAGFEYAAVEPHLFLAYQQKPDGPDKWLTEEETSNVIAKFARLMKKPVREQLRQQSKERVRNQTAARTVQVAPRAAAAASRPATPVPTKKKVDVSNPDALEAAMFESARRIIPGAR